MEALMTLIVPLIFLIGCSSASKIENEKTARRLKTLLFALAPISLAVILYIMYRANPVEVIVKSMTIMCAGYLLKGK